ncbi:MAG: hypothetical protein CYG60_03450 [Actinobacteria bacterium]|nr:MAG: hypothetical protein CYG60_03450 [Actinomycetota bacterium]
MIDAALDYACQGIPVFPLRPGTKVPAVPKREGGEGYRDATTNRDQIRRWWRRWPDANVGVPTGTRSGFLVLDVDPDKGGDGSLKILIFEHGELPATATVNTGGGGQHYYYSYPVGAEIRNNASKLGPGLDIRGEGGYVVVPPSVTTGPYYWGDRSPVAGNPRPGSWKPSQHCLRARRASQESPSGRSPLPKI